MPTPSIELLIEFTKDEDPRTRATAIAGLAKVGDPRGFAPVVVALFDPVDEVRTTAATALGIFKDLRAIEPLMECLADPCEQVGATCAWALGQIPAIRCFELLLDIIANAELAAAVRTAAVTAVGEHAQEGLKPELADAARAALLAALAVESDEELCATVVWALGCLPATDESVTACIAALSAGYEWEVRYAIEALANFGDASALPAVQALVDDERTAVSELAKQACEILGE